MNKTLLLLAAILFSTAFAYSQEKTRKRQQNTKSGSVRYGVLAKNHDIWHGDYSYTYLDQVSVFGSYFHGEKHGDWQYILGDQYTIQAYYKDGDRDSIWVYYKNNQIISEVTFKNNKRDEKAIGYYSNGDVKSIIPYKSGQIHGTRKVFYHDNKLKLIAEYVNDSLCGPLKYYNEDGEIILHLECRHNRPFSIEKSELPDSLKYFAGTLKDGTGLIRIYSKGIFRDSLVLVSEQEYKDGLRFGQTTEYSENGNIKYNGNYINDFMVGQWNFYNPYVENVHKAKMYSLRDSIEIDSTNIYTVKPTNIAIFKLVSPQFHKEGRDGFRRYVANSLKYPENAARSGVSGKVYTNFDVDIVGDISDIRIIKSSHQSFENEAIRVISSSPNWIPGFVDNIPFSCRFIFPINFVLLD